MTTYPEWLEKEYKAWEEALGKCKPYNYKLHPVVRRMLSEDYPADDFLPLIQDDLFKYPLIAEIDAIGIGNDIVVVGAPISGAAARMVYYARKVLDRFPDHVTEIGGGVGQFYAILLAMGYQGSYWILDRPEVVRFQHRYLDYVMDRTRLALSQWLPTSTPPFDFVCSFYALGELDDLSKMQLMPCLSGEGDVVASPLASG